MKNNKHRTSSLLDAAATYINKYICEGALAQDSLAAFDDCPADLMPQLRVCGLLPERSSDKPTRIRNPRSAGKK